MQLRNERLISEYSSAYEVLVKIYTRCTINERTCKSNTGVNGLRCVDIVGEFTLTFSFHDELLKMLVRPPYAAIMSPLT